MYKHIDKMPYEDRKELFKSLSKATPKSIYDNDESVFKSGWTLKDADTTVYSYTKKTLQQAIKNHFKNPKHFGIPRFRQLDTLKHKVATHVVLTYVELTIMNT